MTERDNYPEPGSAHQQDPWEDAIDALLAGELDQLQKEQLKRAAEQDVELAHRIVLAEQLQEQLDALGLEQVPKSLSKKLLAIPGRQRPEHSWWLLASSCASVLLVAGLWFSAEIFTTPSYQPSQREIEIARHEVLLTFKYLEQVSNQAQRQISGEMYGTLVNTLMPSRAAEN